MTKWAENEELKTVIIEKKISPLEVPQKLEKQQRKGTFRLFVKCWHWLKGYTADDIVRLKEAGLRKIEADNELKEAEAFKKMAEATESFARAEAIRQETALKKALSEGKVIDSIDYKEVENAEQRLNSAINKIHLKGGRILIDNNAVKKLIEQGQNEFPNDKIIKVEDDHEIEK
jgi:hypothetical protein